MIEISKDTCKPIKTCLCCGSEKLQTILDLGNQPLANSYLKSQNEEEMTFPLALNYCKNCTHLQLTHVVNPDLLFKHYLYVSGTTQTLRDYFDSFVAITESYFSSIYSRKVLDIACNDGSQLDSFKKFGYETYGIDPAENLYELSSKNHNVICDYLTKNSIVQFGTKFDIITAQNVFAHNTYPKEFLEICRDNLNDDGLIFIQTSQANMVEYGQFDTVYHEHISFFNPESMLTLAKSVDLKLVNVEKTNIHGTSFLFVLAKKDSDYFILYDIEKEQRHTLEIVENFSSRAKNTIEDLQIKMKMRSDELIVGYGAAAKGNTVLNFGQIKFDYIVDDNPMKQGLYTPGMRIPIVSLNHINSLNRKVIWVPLSWNFYGEIVKRIEAARDTTNDSFMQLDFTRL
jgi:2-polyprenyl-3-methyl-5-hydroxy-6-metoxy-1,4-benzoquinol methylase